MARFLLLCLSCFAWAYGHTQKPSPAGSGKRKENPSMQLDSFMRYADFHIHPTYKHYFRPRDADMMKQILKKTCYDWKTGALTIDTAYKRSIQDINWTPYTETPKRTQKALKKGVTSDLRNFDQSGYPEIMYVPGSILCNSYSPYEKQFTLKKFNNWISSKLVTKMGVDRLNAYSKDAHTPFNDFLAEYFYNIMQQEAKIIETQSPTSLYDKNDGSYRAHPSYINSIRMVKDSVELDSIVRWNDHVFTNWKPGQSLPHIITPLVMSIEGAQVLYDTLSGKAIHIINPLNYQAKPDDKNAYFMQAVSNETFQQIHKELLQSVYKLKNLPHRLFFITVGHFTQNQVVGFAKTLDRDPENIRHRALSTITSLPKHREELVGKWFAGINQGVNLQDTTNTAVPDSIGYRIIEAFLDPDSTVTRYKKPTYIDVKHMDIQGRIQYYYMRRYYEKKFNTKIPIIASHFGVSGENQAMAAATGLWPHFDMYFEVENIEKFYNQVILRNGIEKDRLDYWVNRVMGGKNVTSKNWPEYYFGRVLDSFDRAMYRPLDFHDPTIFHGKTYDPFKDFKLDKNKVGWFYPWSVNLFDEEIIEINKSDGIIGLLLDPRQLGAFMPEYKNIKKKYGPQFINIQKGLSDDSLDTYGLSANDLNNYEYFKAEPLIRNLFYIVQVTLQQQKEEAYYLSTGKDLVKTRQKYPHYIYDDILTGKNAWEFVSIGGDFDGLIDPIDFAPTASYIPMLRRRMIVYAWMFAQIHKDVFTDPFTNGPLITSLADSHRKMHQFFYENGQKFIRKYF